MGENALYRLPGAPIMARVGRSVEASRKETAVAAWLQSHQFPVVGLANVEQVIVIDGVPVTFWKYIEQSDRPPVSADLGAILRDLHKLPAPREVQLPAFDPMPKIDERLRCIGSELPDVDREFLQHRKSELQHEFAGIDFELEPGPIHGDAHRHNLLREYGTETVRLIDLEDFCWGPREWDLCVEAIGYKAFGWISESDYDSYVDSYGFDPLRWPGFRVIQSIRELNMTTWLAQRLGESAAVDAEVHRRLRDLRDDDAPREWGTF